MKKVAIGIIALCIGLHATAQNEKSAISNVSSIASASPWRISPGADILMDTYSKLIARTGGIQTCFTGISTITSAIPFGYYLTGKDSGILTFASFLDERSGGNIFRSIFSYRAIGYTYYGACVPNPIVWQSTDSGRFNNEVYAAFLIKQSDYKNAPAKDYSSLLASGKVLFSNQVDAILNYSFEKNNGYIAITNPTAYNNISSSLGLSVTVKLKAGGQVLCYLINNYDATYTIRWKVPVLASGSQALQEEETAGNEYVKLISPGTLEQNSPNPFNNVTRIAYTLPEKYNRAQIVIADRSGVQLKSVALSGHGKGTLTIDMGSFISGTYIYSLIIDGILITSKQMIVNE